jgi:hypothetical protein
VTEIHNHPVFAALSPQAREVVAANAPVLLTDATRVISPANGKIVVVDNGPFTKSVVLRADAPNVFACDWYVPVQTEDGPSAVPCGALTVGLDNGWACAHGHYHYTYGYQG